MVRQLPPGSDGLPIEIYCFTNTVAWVGYESIQADIFDHLYAILPEFKLRVFQAPAGYDLLGTGPNTGAICRMTVSLRLPSKPRRPASQE